MKAVLKTCIWIMQTYFFKMWLMWLRLVLTHKNVIIKLFWAVLLLGVAGLTWLAQRQYILLWHSIGSLAAKSAVIAYLLTLVPGMLKRFGIQSLLQMFHL